MKKSKPGPSSSVYDVYESRYTKPSALDKTNQRTINLSRHLSRPTTPSIPNHRPVTPKVSSTRPSRPSSRPTIPTKNYEYYYGPVHRKNKEDFGRNLKPVVYTSKCF